MCVFLVASAERVVKRRSAAVAGLGRVRQDFEARFLGGEHTHPYTFAYRR